MTLIIEYLMPSGYYNTFIHYNIDSIHASGILLILYRNGKSVTMYDRKDIKSIRIADGTIHEDFGSKIDIKG